MRLAFKFARFVFNWKQLKHYGCCCLCQPRAADTDSIRMSSWEILDINFFDHSKKISSVRCLTDWRQSSETKDTVFCTNIEPTHRLEVTLSSHYCAIFRCCNTTQYYNWAIWEATTLLHPFNGPFSRTTRVSRYQKGKTNLRSYLYNIFFKQFYWSYLSNDI